MDCPKCGKEMVFGILGMQHWHCVNCNNDVYPEDTPEQPTDPDDDLTVAYLVGFHKRDDEMQRLTADRDRLRYWIDYAKDAPNFDDCKSVLADALDGVTGAYDVVEIRGEREQLRTKLALQRSLLHDAWQLLDLECPNDAITEKIEKYLMSTMSKMETVQTESFNKCRCFNPLETPPETCIYYSNGKCQENDLELPCDGRLLEQTTIETTENGKNESPDIIIGELYKDKTTGITWVLISADIAENQIVLETNYRRATLTISIDTFKTNFIGLTNPDGGDERNETQI